MYVLSLLAGRINSDQICRCQFFVGPWYIGQKQRLRVQQLYANKHYTEQHSWAHSRQRTVTHKINYVFCQHSTFVGLPHIQNTRSKTNHLQMLTFRSQHLLGMFYFYLVDILKRILRSTVWLELDNFSLYCTMLYCLPKCNFLREDGIIFIFLKSWLYNHYSNFK